MEVNKKGLTGSALKWIAIVTMFIDHVGATVLTRLLLYYPYEPAVLGNDENYTILYWIMRAMRTIGRLAFPIFCFLLVEGFQHTSNKCKYVVRMAVFAILTEIPFDLAFAGKIVNWGYQNVMLTLFIGILTMWGCSKWEKRFVKKKLVMFAGFIGCVAVGMLVAHLMCTDYAAKGVACILVLYFLRQNKLYQSILGALSFYWEEPAMLSFLLIYQYNGQRGKQMKYFFYLFYPLHLILLYLVCLLMGIHWIPVI